MAFGLLELVKDLEKIFSVISSWCRAEADWIRSRNIMLEVEYLTTVLLPLAMFEKLCL
jgi:hypothetical protein